MVCGTCGRAIKNTARFCPFCGMNQLDNPDFENAVSSKKKKYDIKTSDSFSVIGAVLACASFVISFFAFDITNNIQTGKVYYSTGIFEYIFFALIIFAVVLVSLKERTLLGKAVTQFCTMTVSMVLIKMISSNILNIAIFYEYFLPRFNFDNTLGFSILIVLISSLLCIVAIMICNIVSSRRNLSHKKIGSSVPYILMFVFAYYGLADTVYNAIILNSNLLESVVDVSASEVASATISVLGGICIISIIAVIITGFVSKDVIRKFLCGSVLAMVGFAELIRFFVSLAGLVSIDALLINVVICLALILISGVMVFIAVNKLKKNA